MQYLIKRNGKDINSLDLNGILSTIYGPIVPSNKRMESVFYEKDENKFEVRPFEEGSTISGKISLELISQLASFGISLQSTK
jgi:hypothetical protein